MEQKLNNLFLECVKELEKIGIDILNEKQFGKIEISISKRNNKRYGCCKQEEPNKKYRVVNIIGRRKIIKYEKFNKHYIEISKWVMELEDDIIKNTIMHELIHCIPYCNNHGKEFKKYAKMINNSLGYDISRVGNKKEDYRKSDIEYNETKIYKYIITCKSCSQKFYRQRLNKNFLKKYRCAKCGGKFEIKSEKKEMEYIKKLRKFIGHDPILMCACGCLIFNEKGQVLLQKRSDDNLWGNPGGSMDIGETIYDTIIREIKEETNLEIDQKDLKIFNVYSGEEQHHIYPNKDEMYYVNIIFETNKVKGQLNKDVESKDLKFFDINNLPSNVTKPFECVKRDLLKRYGQSGWSIGTPFFDHK